MSGETHTSLAEIRSIRPHVTQERLSEIAVLEQRTARTKARLNRLLKRLRRDLLNEGTVESGEHKAYIVERVTVSGKGTKFIKRVLVVR